MLRLLADENLNNNIVRALRMRESGLDIVRVQEVGLSGESDPTVLEWAASELRVVVTHDVSTMTRHAYERMPPAGRCPAWSRLPWKRLSES